MPEAKRPSTAPTSPPAGLRNLQLAIDAFGVTLAMVAAAWLRPALMGLVPGLKQASQLSDQVLVAYFVLPLWLALVVVVRLHGTFQHPLSQSELLARLVKLNLFGLLALSLLQFLTQSVVNRSLVALFLLLSFVFMYAQRTLSYGWTRYQHARGHARPNLLLVGRPSRRMHDFVRAALASPLRPQLLGYLCGSEPSEGLSLPPADAIPLTQLGELSELQRMLEDRAIDQVVFLAPYQRPDSVPRELAVCEALGVPASFLVDLKQLSRAAPRISDLYEHCVISFDVAPKRPEALAIKHGLDPLLGLLALVLTLPFMLVIALLIAVTMGRPILFTQERAGLYGRSFRMFKFRTMQHGAEARRSEVLALNEQVGPVFKARDDPRITRLGRLLRRSSLDELPQLFNVITGTMSMVGPRPLPVQEHEQIRGWQRRRLSVKPGITGLWQISGRSDVDFEQWMLLDLKYVDDWSLWLDVQILLKTIPVVLFGRGAR
ncbi:MAG: Undecaprenyl-phosphate galactosephosphotransferase [Myxococcaceae bacterium]|nr:Undecaprenyl-phosphate galactosephosphotransferase [Myxococcaceae bacterium]